MTSSINQVTILGHCNTTLSVVLDMLQQQYKYLHNVTIVSNIRPDENSQAGIPYVTPGLATTVVQASDWAPTFDHPHIIASMSTKVRTILLAFFQQRFNLSKAQLTTLVHPFSAVAKTATLDEGVIINPGAVLAPYCHLKPLAYVNRNVSIGHHTTIEQLATINPGATVAGKCFIGEGVTIGAGAVINDQISIGKHSFIGAGAVVTKDIPDNVVAYGTPAKVIKKIP